VYAYSREFSWSAPAVQLVSTRVCELLPKEIFCFGQHLCLAGVHAISVRPVPEPITKEYSKRTFPASRPRNARRQVTATAHTSARDEPHLPSPHSDPLGLLTVQSRFRLCGAVTSQSRLGQERSPGRLQQRGMLALVIGHHLALAD
jgi:hypothetical protein